MSKNFFAEKLGHLWFAIVHIILNGIFSIFCGMKVEGLEKLRNIKGACIMAGNHTSYMDPPIFGALSWRRVNCIAQDNLFKVPVLRPLIISLGAIPLNRENPDPSTIKIAVAKLKRGEIIGIFPEGRRILNEEDEGSESRKGVSALARMSGAPVVPISIIGGKDCISIHHKFIPRFRKLKVVIGDPVVYEKSPDKSKEKENMAKFAHDLMETIMTPVNMERNRN